jgi:nitrogenase-associated protein
MAKITFWEKPGCQGNSRQREILLASGHELEVRNLLSEPWSEEILSKFFGNRPVTDWFNPAHPRVKSGEVIPSNYEKEEALHLMISEPLFIVRPLMQVGSERLAGFNVEQVHNWIGLSLDSVGERAPMNCPCVTGRANNGGPNCMV